MSKKKDVYIIKAEENTSKQKIKERKVGDGRISPEVDFSTLIEVYENSFIVGGVVDKIGTKASSGFERVYDGDTPNEQEAKLQRTLDNIDTEYAFLSLYVTGNVFFEKLKSLNGQVMLTEFLTSEVKVKLTPVSETDDKGNKVAKGLVLSYIQDAGNGNNQEFAREEVVHIKTVSLKSRYYGESRFSKAVQQIALLENIDRFYADLFDKGMIKVSLLTDPNNVLTTAQKETIKNIITDRLKGQSNSYTTAIIPGEIKKLDLQNDEDTKAFLEYRDKLIESIAIALNMPYDLLVSRNSNRATSEVAMEVLNTDVVAPLQERFCNQLRAQLREDYGDIVDKINLVAIDTTNQKENMEVDTGYVKAGILEANEVRAKLGYEEHPDGNGLNAFGNLVDLSNLTDPKEEAIAKMVEEIYTPETLQKIQLNNVRTA